MNLKHFLCSLFCVFSFCYFLGFTDMVYATEIEEHSTKKLVEKGEDVSNNIKTTAESITSNKAPELTIINDRSLSFYEGQIVTKEMLLADLFVYDKEDALSEEPLTIKDIRITKIVYSDGKIVDGEETSSYMEEWDNDVPKNFTLDTWFMQMNKENSPFSHKITYEVTDSEGLTSTLEREIFIEYNAPPELVVKDRYFTLKEAHEGKITLNSLLKDIRSTDDESCFPHSLHNEDSNSCLSGNEPCDFASDRVSIIGYNAEKFKSYTRPGYEVLTCIVIDEFGKETVIDFTVFILDDGEVSSSSQNMSIRSINRKYYEKNLDWHIEDISKEEIEILNQNGGLQVDSYWYKDSEYRSLIQGVFSDAVSVKRSWQFSSSEIKLLKKYIRENEFGSLDFELKDG